MRFRLLLTLTFLTVAATAQVNPVKSGRATVNGHVYCADTNAPARRVSVQLETVKQASERIKDAPQYGGLPTGGIVKTALDGSFTFTNIPPGVYYVAVSAEGYLSPRIDAADIDNAEPPPPAGQPPLAIPKVTAQSDQTLTSIFALSAARP